MDAAEVDLRLATSLHPAHLQPFLPGPNVIRDATGPAYTLNNDDRFDTPSDAFTQFHSYSRPRLHSGSTEQGDNGKEVKGVKSRSRRERAKEREEGRTGVNALLPNEMPVEPPHDPDETVTMAYTRSCSMARPDIPPELRCVVMLKPDYQYKMCDGCRMRFKLAEVRANGIRYEGKRKATGLPDDSGRGLKHKVRPQLIQYNGELVLDPAYMHTYELDPRMFGPQGHQSNAAALENAAFLKALQSASDALGQGSISREASVAGTSPHEDSEPSSSGSVPATTSDVTMTSVASDNNSSSADSHSRGPEVPVNDGLLRVRICSVKTCHTPIPIDYHWKMCETCRSNYRAWGIEKRARMREKRLKEMTREERDRYQSLAAGKKAQQEANIRGERGIVDTNPVIDPYIAPKRCTFRNCKNHVPGNSGYKRCPNHRKESRVYASSYAKKRELQKAVYDKAIQEGRDPVEALKEYLSNPTEQEGGLSEVESNSQNKSWMKKSKDKKQDNDATASISSPQPEEQHQSIPPSQRRVAGSSVCAGQNCQNLLFPTYPFRLCDICRDWEKARRPAKASKRKPSQDVSADLNFEVMPSADKDMLGSDPRIGVNNSNDVPPESLGAAQSDSPTLRARGADSSDDQSGNLRSWVDDTSPPSQNILQNPLQKAHTLQSSVTGERTPSVSRTSQLAQPDVPAGATGKSVTLTSTSDQPPVSGLGEPPPRSQSLQQTTITDTVFQLRPTLPPLFSTTPLPLRDSLITKTTTGRKRKGTDSGPESPLKSTTSKLAPVSSTSQVAQFERQASSNASSTHLPSSIPSKGKASSKRRKSSSANISVATPTTHVTSPATSPVASLSSILAGPSGHSYPYTYPSYARPLPYYQIYGHPPPPVISYAPGSGDVHGHTLYQYALPCNWRPPLAMPRSPSAPLAILTPQDMALASSSAPYGQTFAVSGLEQEGEKASRINASAPSIDDSAIGQDVSKIIDTSQEVLRPNDDSQENEKTKTIKRMPSSLQKICESPSCSAVLHRSRPYKFCDECRKKRKLKKKMSEMKKRLKLVKKSAKQSSIIGAHTSPAKDQAVDNDEEDADADGDIDMDA